MHKAIEHLQGKFREGRKQLFRHISWSDSCLELLQAHASLIDDLVKEIYEYSCASADHIRSRSGYSGLAIVATGGYGRRELHPFSDIDIAFIPSEEEGPWVDAVVHTAFKLVMDVFLSLRDVRVGYSFRPIAEANSWDTATKTALLDLRHICGGRGLADRLAVRIREVLSPLDLMLESLSAGVPSRGQERSLYSVEPNLKEGPGSLRDLHRARWIFKLLLGADDGELDDALRARAGFQDRRIAEVHEAAQWFLRARTWLHLAAGKLSDVLITNYQDRIARELGGMSAQAWLSRHLAYSEKLAAFRESAVRALLQGPYEIDGMRLAGGSLHLPDPPSDTGNSIRMFRLSQRYSIPLSLGELKRLDDGREKALQEVDPTGEEIWAFKEMLGEDRNVAPMLRRLAEFGYLDRFIPRFSESMRFVPPDPAHRYTVGEHSIRIVEHLERLRRGLDSEGQRFTDLLGQCAHFDLLCLAALLHDAGKLLPDKDHCESGAALAKSVSARLNLAPEKREILEVLTGQHLLLVRTSRLLDLKSPAVIRKVSEQLPSLEALRHLYVFSYVDTCAVAEKNWTSMDYRDLEELYRKMQEFVERRGAEAAGAEAPEDKGVLIRKKLAALQAFNNEAAVLKHCDAMPAGYVLNTPLEEIASHLQLLERLEAETVALDIYNRPGDDYSELTICTYDDPGPGLLAKITGVLYGCHADIHKAQVFTLKKEKPIVLDTLWIRANGRQISERKARRIRTGLKEVLSGAITVEQYLKQSGKAPPGGVTLDGIDLRNDLSEEHTVAHMVAHDLQGLLYLMTRSLSLCGLDIHSARIATWNGRAENNFYVTAAAGGRIPDADLPAWTEQLARVLRGGAGSENS